MRRCFPPFGPNAERPGVPFRTHEPHRGSLASSKPIRKLHRTVTCLLRRPLSLPLVVAVPRCLVLPLLAALLSLFRTLCPSKQWIAQFASAAAPRRDTLSVQPAGSDGARDEAPRLGPPGKPIR